MQVKSTADHFDVIRKKHFDGRPVSLVDIWGEMIGAVFGKDLERKEKSRLSDQQKVADSGELPFPIYTALYVREGQPTEMYAGEIYMVCYPFVGNWQTGEMDRCQGEKAVVGGKQLGGVGMQRESDVLYSCGEYCV